LHRGYSSIATAGRVLRRTSATAAGRVLGTATASGRVLGTAAASGRVLGTAAAEAATVRVVRLGLRFRAEKKGESENYHQRCGHYQRELAAQRDSQSAAAAPFVDKGVVVRTQPYADPYQSRGPIWNL
jgi:hypothetical protein